MNAQEWFDLGSYQKVNGHKVFVIDTDSDKQSSLPVLCILHGFPTSSYDYWKVLPKLRQHFRVIIHDHIGFGFSDKPKDYSYSLFEQADIAQQLWKQLNITKCYLLAHDYGTSVFTELLARHNANQLDLEIQKIALCNGSMHIELAQLLLMQKLMRNPIGGFITRLSTKSTVKRNLKKIYIDPNQLSDKEIDAIWEMMNFNEGNKVLAKISRYTFERKKYWDRWIGALKETQLPIEIIWPNSDPICVEEMATTIKQETQNSNLTWLDSVGHFPMLEQPETWGNVIIESLLLN